MIRRKKATNDKKTAMNEVPGKPIVKEKPGTKKMVKPSEVPIEMQQEGNRPRRFYRSNLSTIVWDPEKNKPLADFSEGHFTSDDPVVIQKLLSLGYIEIPLDCQTPPDVIVNQPSLVLKQAHVPILSPGLNPTQAQNRIAAVSEEI